MGAQPQPGQLWSLTDRGVVVCLTRDAGNALRPPYEAFIAIVVLSDGGEPAWHPGQELVVHAPALCQEWTVKPLTGVAR